MIVGRSFVHIDCDAICAERDRLRTELAAYRSAVVPTADHARVLQQRDAALEQVDALTRSLQDARDRRDSVALGRALDCLQRVMSTLARSAGGPGEERVWNEARGLLVEHGYRTAETDAYVKAYEEWQARRG